MLTSSSIRVFVPSYKRRDRVQTLRKVYGGAVLVVAESEQAAYERANPGAEVWGIPDAMQGNIARVRNYILDNAGCDAVCMMDDDITRLGRFVGNPDTGFGYERDTLAGSRFESFLERYTALCEDLGLHLWGVNIQAANRLYHQAEPFSFTKQVLGPFCVHVQSDIRYDEGLPLKEDYDLFLQHMQRYRGVLRVNAAWYANGGSKGALGGCAASRSIGEERRELDMLKRKWGAGVVREDSSSKRGFDFNPIIKCPVRGV